MLTGKQAVSQYWLTLLAQPKGSAAQAAVQRAAVESTEDLARAADKGKTWL